MSLAEEIDAIFPDEENIPKGIRLLGPIEQDEYLVNGRIRQWDGPTQDVKSPVFVRTPSDLVQKSVGRYPLLTKKESLEAFN